MVNLVWLFLIVGAIIVGFATDNHAQVVTAVTTSANAAVQLAIGLVGILSLWMGLMRVAEAAGLVKLLARGLQKVIAPLFPDVPRNDPAMGAMLLNMAANILGLGNAATPFGIKAMQRLQKLNTQHDTASNAMCMFLAINTSSIQLIPTGAMAVLIAAGATNPTAIVLPGLIATTGTTLIAIFAAKLLEKSSARYGSQSC